MKSRARRRWTRSAISSGDMHKMVGGRWRTCARESGPRPLRRSGHADPGCAYQCGSAADTGLPGLGHVEVEVTSPVTQPLIGQDRAAAIGDRNCSTALTIPPATTAWSAAVTATDASKGSVRYRGSMTAPGISLGVAK